MFDEQLIEPLVAGQEILVSSAALHRGDICVIEVIALKPAVRYAVACISDICGGAEAWKSRTRGKAGWDAGSASWPVLRRCLKDG